MEVIKQGALFLMSEECFENYFDEHNYFDVPCFKALLSKGLGLAIIAGSLLVKVPQVLKIFHNKSGEGINLFSVLLDLSVITFHMAYSYVNGFPFSAWGDGTFLAFQTAAIAAMVLFYNGAKAQSILFCVFYGSLVYVLCSGLTPFKILVTAQSLNIPVLLLGKFSQAFTNYKNGSTGQLSAATAFLLLAGSLARIFTSIQETGDIMMVLTYCASSFANGVIVAQMLYYWNKTDAKSGSGAAKKAAGKSVAKKPKSKKVD
ncbi:mannose-P-dolichol utilization defect 1 protein homolog [Stomoxys calcitrans]|uniref:Mannose-P-dolichol utilization defect 1 protein homolog n=1 Tax=Stomoxys calcitrans TaxID=35570 RepID=A0A1I8NNK4_STOCA|nr:mannose-P-dolichol utilization defect 1 protein homolog [Stomoxys calcitrans]XP_013110993.1 mannose-P-dolichol utilization defect 1 protein homolog [Stomoxys calcitrans]XP_059221992.1 mannose-P-dolichol utilization defect 1 protein homolog [Stomoxys calcitrans]XP_059221993.1 mannose-P-dolichol utilization defect 1 protein homolog [Stomoxys calcitrans]XP_059221994.1 mannose-P-dolichol utilization defect 1 protein homolog [Stomoxys calcitrans]